MPIEKDKLRELLRKYSVFGFILSRKTWNWLELSRLKDISADKSPKGEIYFLRQLADWINRKLAEGTRNPIPVHGGELASASVLMDILRYLIEIYTHHEQTGVIPRGTDFVKSQRGETTVSKPPPSFVKLFPPVSVLSGRESENDFIKKSKAVPEDYDTIIQEIILLFLSISNPALKPMKPLFDDTDLKEESPYVALVRELEKYFGTQPPLREIGMTLFDCLYAPIQASADSLEGQLKYINQHWGHFLPDDLLDRLLLSMDVLHEERLMRGLGPGRLEALRFDQDAYGMDLGYAEPSAFSRDADWMSNVVLIAKTVYVWLYQLSKKYQRDIRLLSDIPDEELDQLARWGFTGLWLIGLWKRSSASQKIKQMMGNPEAAASAYSLYDYAIADDLGGEDALRNLKERAWQRGIRLASDMVPNHVGIYSKWVVEHPDWFIQSSNPPFPAYQYTGVDLSEDDRVVVQIEDGYWQHRDAAVVFKRIDKWTGDARYIYHGNDGTSMPWNDTAQLNFLLPEVREAVIQTILHVARHFPIIRFDAAMTLAKRHYQRLWFPLPGEGGAIPSRAEHGMTREEFDAHIPKEFWREVVDRVTQEQPDTLLLAEAFWLMEGYFVRTLGMHRVYNSAFMNMLKMEDNAKYRTTIKNVLEFSPEVLKRFVNFMNNPDEMTAVEQFGRGDKYFGVAMMMVTMPGLPMFGHGQIEGFTEKYGMEYRRSYWDEQIDWGLLRHHETHIFPLMHRRYLFSGSENFAFFDFNSAEGWVDENVMAYTNRVGGERAIILYNNAYSTTKGSIHTSTAINVGEADSPMLVRKSLGEALQLNTEDNCYYIFRDYQSGLEFIRHGRYLAEKGIFAELHAYQYHAFMDFREIHDMDGSWGELNHRLNGSGVPSIHEAHRELKMEPILGPYRALMNAEMIETLQKIKRTPDEKYLSAVKDFYSALNHFISSRVDTDPLAEKFLAGLVSLEKPKKKVKKSEGDEKYEDMAHLLYAWLSLESLGEFQAGEKKVPGSEIIPARYNDWLFGKTITEAYEQYLNHHEHAYWDSRLVLILLSHGELLQSDNNGSLKIALRHILVDTTVRDYLQIHSYDGKLWLNKERLDRMVRAMILAESLSIEIDKTSRKTNLSVIKQNSERLLLAAENSGYEVEKMVSLLSTRH